MSEFMKNVVNNKVQMCMLFCVGFYLVFVDFWASRWSQHGVQNRIEL